jgi:hypothetical protein
MRRTAAALVFGAALLAAGPSAAADPADLTDMQALRKAIDGDKRALVESTLKLTPAEAKKFWPIYDTYQRSLEATGRRRTVALEVLIAQDRPLTELYAKRLATELAAIDDAEAKSRRTLNSRLLRALPPKKAVRYLQIENKAHALQLYDIAVTFPLIR